MVESLENAYTFSSTWFSNPAGLAFSDHDTTSSATHVVTCDDNIVYVGSGTGRTAWLLSALAQLDLNVYAFERHVPNHDVSAQTLREVRRHTKVHKLKVASSV